MNLITLLGRYNFQDNKYNGFDANTFPDVSSYSVFLNKLQDEYFTEVKTQIERIILKESYLPTLNLFFKGRFQEFEEVDQKLKERDTILEEQRNKHRLALVKDSIGENHLSEIGRNYVSQITSLFRLIQDYFEDELNIDDLAEHVLPFEKEFEVFEENIFFPTVMEKVQRESILKSKDRLNELYNFYFKEDEIQKKNTAIQKEKDFIDYLHHENKEALLKKLHELLDNEKGRVVAITIKALEKLGFISVLGKRADLYKCMEKEFGYIGASQGLNDFYVKLNDEDHRNHATLKNELQHQMEILSKVK